jgi:hypothetical protein
MGMRVKFFNALTDQIMQYHKNRTMKKILKTGAIVLIVLVVIVFSGAAYVYYALPEVKSPENLVVELTPERIEKGRHLANEVMGCTGCHAERDFNRYAGPVIPETMGAGGEFWDETKGFPGKLYAPNLTPYHLGDWTDGELFRAITSGVNKDGKALFPIMPYLQYGKLPKEDIYAVIAYLRTLKPVEKDYPRKEIGFPLNFIEKLIPAEGTHHLGPDETDPVRHGEYLVTAAVCYDCHTPTDGGQYIDEMAFAGGFEFNLKTGGIVRAANITSDAETGIGSWTKDMFIKKFKAFSDSNFVAYEVPHGEFNTEMPWEYYAKLTEAELGAMYEYLQTLTPVKNRVVKFSAPVP